MRFEVPETDVLKIWEQYSGRTMTPEERAKAHGHPLVDHLRTYPRAVLLRAAFSAQRKGADLDWLAWRDWSARHSRSRERQAAKRNAARTRAAAQARATARTDRVFNAVDRAPSRYTTQSGKANAKTPGYSGGTLPHAMGKPSERY